MKGASAQWIPGGRGDYGKEVCGGRFGGEGVDEVAGLSVLLTHPSPTSGRKGGLPADVNRAESSTRRV